MKASKLAILSDAQRWPKLFHWFGEIGRPELRNWMATHHIVVPEDLQRFWQATGGADAFDTETILGPFGDPRTADDVCSVNEYEWSHGLPRHLLVFHVRGGQLGAVDMKKGTYRTLAAETYQALATYPGFDEYYAAELREFHADRYDLK